MRLFDKKLKQYLTHFFPAKLVIKNVGLVIAMSLEVRQN